MSPYTREFLVQYLTGYGLSFLLEVIKGSDLDWALFVSLGSWGRFVYALVFWEQA